MTEPASPPIRPATRRSGAGGEVPAQVLRPVLRLDPPRRVTPIHHRSSRQGVWSGSGSTVVPRAVSADGLPGQSFARQRRRPGRPSPVGRFRLVYRASSADPPRLVPRSLFLALFRPPACVLPHPGAGPTGGGSWPGCSPAPRLPCARRFRVVRGRRRHSWRAPDPPRPTRFPRESNRRFRPAVLRTRCVRGRAASRQPDRSRLLASPRAALAVVPARPPKRSAGCSDPAGVQLPAPRTVCNL
jgi:hypothetical protein